VARAVLFLLVGLAAACTGPNPAFVTGAPEPPADAASGADGRVADGPTTTDAPAADAPAADAPAADAPLTDTPLADAPPVADAGPDAFVLPAGCGTGTADIGGVMNADGVVIDTDGSLFYLTDDTTHSYVGRIRPGQTAEPRWARIDDSPTTWGLALDSARKRIYVLVVDGPGALVAYDNIQGAPVGSRFLTGIDNGNDVVVGPDGDVYYGQQGNRHIYRVPPQGGTPEQVTMMPIGNNGLGQSPAALAFAADGGLLVGLEHGGSIYRLTLAGGREAGRNAVGSWTGWANGLTFDRRQRLYVAIYDDTAPRSVVRLEADGSATPVATGGRFSSLAFGRGALDCRDLYIAEPFAAMRRVRVSDSL
jgi:sugar lactone lactonase YvrE